MEVVDVLVRLGGVASSATLSAATSRRRLEAAVEAGLVQRDGWGRYSLPATLDSVRAAHRLTAVVSHRSAALLHGWEVRGVPARPELLVPVGRRVDRQRRVGVDLRWRRLAPFEIDRSGSVAVTTPVRTVTDCAADLDFAEALAVADSALRHGDVGAHEIVAAADARRSPAARRVVSSADARAANPFESALRAIALDVPGLDLEPQVVVPGIGRPDLLDRRLRLIVEAESFAWHGQRRQLDRDCRRYNAFVLHGYLVVRFSWEQVMLEPDYVRRVLTDLVDLLRAGRLSTPGLKSRRQAL